MAPESMSNGKAPVRADPKATAPGYELVRQDEELDLQGSPRTYSKHSTLRTMPGAERRLRSSVLVLSACLVILVGANLYLSLPYFFASSSTGPGGSGCGPPGHVPQYFQAYPELWAGVTATGAAANMAQTRTFDPTATFVPNEPLQTAVPVEGMGERNESIFRMMGYLSPYFPSPGFGADEYPLPAGAEIIQVQMLSRHGARYPTPESQVAVLGEKIANASAGKFQPKGDLAFLKDWRYQLGNSILVPRGRQELFDSGVLHSYMYGSLYNPNSKIIMRTTTQDRMLKSAENWAAGFFGLEWTNNATIEVIIEETGFNNSLAGASNCPNAWTKGPNNDPRDKWIETYLQNATARFQSMTEGFDWTPADVYAAQNMCPYETVAYGYSRFCELFNYKEWQDFGYSIDLQFTASCGFHAPASRAVGLGYQQEMLARLNNHTLGYSGSQINTTLDGSTETFPLNQTLYFDFSHDTNIVSVLTALGLRQFADDKHLPPLDHNPGAAPSSDTHQFSVSHITPFGARLDIELIRAPRPVAADRKGDGYVSDDHDHDQETKYIHMVLNQRTLPLGKSFPECGADRKDGWCELGVFLDVQSRMQDRADFDYACFGDYERVGYGDVTDGAPPST